MKKPITKLKNAEPKIAPAAPVPLKSTKAARVSLEFVKPGASRVCVAGSFNHWKPELTPLVPKPDGRWVGELSVAPGRYEYLFVVDGQWILDPKAKETVQNPYGGKNAVLMISA